MYRRSLINSFDRNAKNILFIPHTPNIGVINRVYEFAKNTDSYFLNWNIDNASFRHKVFSQLKSLSFKQEGKVVQIPLIFKPDILAPRLNTFNLNRLIGRLQIDVVVNANALLFDIGKIKVPVIYDLVDDHLEINEDIGLDAKRIEKIKEDIKNSAAVVCVTEILEEKVKSMGLHTNIITLGNGIYIERFQKAKNLKSGLGLTGKKVFGYIGGVEEWTGIDKACEAYMSIKSDKNAMIVVGDSNSHFFKELKRKYQTDIIFSGRVDPQKVGDYFKTVDIGLIPFKLNAFTHNAFPIKALEYGLAGASVLSTPLKLLQKRGLPFITFAQIEDFPKYMYDIEKKDIDFDFNHYSWEKLSMKFIDFIHTTVLVGSYKEKNI